MAANLCTGDDDELPLCLLQDLLCVAAFLARHPLHAAYALLFSRYIVSLAAFFCPLLASTSLLVVVLVTAAPYVSTEWTGAYSLGRTCGDAVDALCAAAEDTCAGVDLVAQICAFVLGYADGAAVLRAGEIVSGLSDISGSCFLLEEKRLLSGTQDCCNLVIEPPLQQTLLIRDKIGEIHHEIDDTIPVCEDLKEFKEKSGSFSSNTFVQKLEEEEDRMLNGSDANRLECVPESVEMKKCEQVRSNSSVSGRIRQWEAHVCRNSIQIQEETANNPLDFSMEKRSVKEMKESTQLETKPREIPVVEESVQVQQQPLDTKTSSEKCSELVQAEELSGSIVQHQQERKEQSQDVQAEPELRERKDVRHGQESQEQCHKDVQVEQDHQEQEYNHTEPEEELQDQEDKVTQPDPKLHGHEYKDADAESESVCDGARDDSLKLTSIARHSRTSSGNLVTEGLPWKRTLGCKLYEERMKLKVCREPAVVGCNDDMDMLWEAYEASGSSDKVKGANTQEDFAVEGKNREGEDEDEGSVRQLCCLQALNFSTRKMNFAGGKRSLGKISKVLKRMTALSRIRSRRNLEE